jgi:HD-GYP domain-containing protein (c-di-GMP phosphodiesterase class II)/HAMP domain-containing protein
MQLSHRGRTMNLPTFLQFEFASFHSKVARRIFLLFILCALIPLSVLAYFSYNQVTKSLYSQADGDLRLTSKATGMTTFERLEFLESDLDMLSTILEKGAENIKVRSVSGLRERLGARFKSLILRAENGSTKKLLDGMMVIPHLTKEEQDHIHSGKALVITRLTAEKRTAIYLVKAIDPLRSRSSRALFFGEISPEYLWGEGLLSPAEFFVLDNSGNVLFPSFPEYVPHDDFKNALHKNVSLGSFTWTYGNNSYIAHYWNLFMFPQFHTNWIVVQSRSQSDILAPISNFKIFFLLLFLLTFFVVVLLSLVQIRRSLVPIKLLHEATQKIAAKKLESRVTIKTNDEFEELGRSFNEMAASLENYLQMMTILRHIGLALSAEKNNNCLLELILDGAKKITNADGCALYTVTKDKQLRRSIMHIDSLNLVINHDHADEVKVPLYDEGGKPNTRTAITFSAHNGSAVNIHDMYSARGFDFAPDRDYDRTLGYQTRSFLSVPVNDHENEIVGVLQLTNAQDRLSQEVVPFSDEDQRLLEALASQAAVAFSKNKLIDDFEELFDSLVELIATAIDMKSPYTGDHCRRVPELTMMLAEAVSNKKEGIFKDFRLSEEELHELKIAALLHDCGKVTTPVHIADKATRLETIFDRIHIIDTRFEVVKRDAQSAFFQKQLDEFSGRGKEYFLAKQEELIKNLVQIEKDRDFVRTCNSGVTVMDGNLKERIKNIALNYRWMNADGIEVSILSDAEVYMLTSATVGTLTPADRQVINQHVEITVKMLESLHYPKSLRNVPTFAQAHHERMDGKGYPKGLTKEEIPVQGRIIAIADIFEAMTAKDRPYKRGLKLMEALCALGSMKQEGHVDPDLFDVFINEKIYLRYAEKYLPPAQIDEVVLSQIPGYVPRSR